MENPDIGWKLYTASFKYFGKTWSIDFYAESMKDAEFRVEAMKSTLNFEGKLTDNGRSN